MTRMNARDCTLLMVDFQQRLMPAIHEGDAAVAVAAHLLAAARLLEVPVIYTEQYPRGLGHTLDALRPGKAEPVVEKTTFDACRDTDLLARITTPQVVVAGCEAHVCVMQTVLGLLEGGKRVHLCADATSSRRAQDRGLALERARAAGADIVSTEMAIFEWLGDAQHPQFREALKLVK